MRTTHAGILIATVVASGMTVVSGVASADFSFNILHNNDGESKLLAREEPEGSGDVYGGAAHFVAAIDSLRNNASVPVITLSSGDNFLASPEYDASLQLGINFDALVLGAIGYDALAIGNHDLDFGPEALAALIEAVPAVDDGGVLRPLFLSSNLDFQNEPSLQSLVDAGRIAGSTVIERDGERIGVIGATTENLASISSPGATVIGPVQDTVQALIDELTAAGVNKIVLISHLQNIEQELALTESLSGIDVVIAGGGDEFLSNGTGDAINGADRIFGTYPLMTKNADGGNVAVVTTPGNYQYVGELTVVFDDDGNLLSGEGDTILVAASRFGADPEIEKTVVEPVNAYTDALDADIIAESAVALDGRRSTVRSTESNLGRLVADALAWQATKDRTAGGLAATGNAMIGMQNGGGMRNDSVIPAGGISRLDTFAVLPFSNFVSVREGLSVDDLIGIVEHGVGAVGGEGGTGRFANWSSNLAFSYDPSAEPGERLVEVSVDGEPVWSKSDGALSDKRFDLASVDFLMRGGDDFPFEGDFYRGSTSYQQAFANYLAAEDGLGGTITATQYPESGVGQIVRTP